MEPAGPVADETARLVAALRARTTHPGAPGAGARSDDPQPEATASTGSQRATDDPPGPASFLVAGALKAVRAVRPETIESAADALALGAQGLRDLADVWRERQEGRSQGTGGPGPGKADAPDDDPDSGPTTAAGSGPTTRTDTTDLSTPTITPTTTPSTTRSTT